MVLNVRVTDDVTPPHLFPHHRIPPDPIEALLPKLPEEGTEKEFKDLGIEDAFITKRELQVTASNGW